MSTIGASNLTPAGSGERGADRSRSRVHLACMGSWLVQGATGLVGQDVFQSGLQARSGSLDCGR
jgi:hypothetical protein